MFKPYPISTLGKLVSIILEDITLTDEEFAESGHRPKFLEVGCGVGTKLTMVSKLFGLDVTGFDYNEVYCQAAIDLLTAKGCTNWHVTRRDALEVYAEYQEADIIYLNRPFVHLLKQEALERLVFAAMHRGAYVILGNYASTPEGWQQIAEDKVAAVFRKPL
jgi:protein-L-isoaspartate O-methyltransferase